MGTPYKPPGYHEEAFNCPNCGAYAKQEWSKLVYMKYGSSYNGNMELSACSCCEKNSYWYADDLPPVLDTTVS